MAVGQYATEVIVIYLFFNISYCVRNSVLIYLKPAFAQIWILTHKKFNLQTHPLIAKKNLHVCVKIQAQLIYLKQNIFWCKF